MSIAEDRAVSSICRHRGTEKHSSRTKTQNYISETWCLSKIKDIDGKLIRCPVCEKSGAVLKRVDHYLCFFKIPVLRVRKGDVFLSCNDCESIMAKDYRHQADVSGRQCHSCGQCLYGDVYCPQCGRQV